jgi:hypothetical protein
MKCPKCESLEKENLELLSKLRLLTKIGDTIAQDLRERDFFPALAALWEKAKC